MSEGDTDAEAETETEVAEAQATEAHGHGVGADVGVGASAGVRAGAGIGGPSGVATVGRVLPSPARRLGASGARQLPLPTSASPPSRLVETESEKDRAVKPQPKLEAAAQS